ncbi:hypothetical protein RHGRI_017513 [Rhododendron griersonianum]|uniref:Uncharacterized protein n=1 Tax=Rhododendron griersonianum TaxID=479676 RepID=A0AAV6JY36_9ERIC|nr:hypothetical protein RHGRI_017513 [Rhododendron griersonianum]
MLKILGVVAANLESVVSCELWLDEKLLDNAMLRLQISGFSVLGFALKVKYSELLELRSMTVFNIVDGGQPDSRRIDLGMHVVLNRR